MNLNRGMYAENLRIIVIARNARCLYSIINTFTKCAENPLDSPEHDEEPPKTECTKYKQQSNCLNVLHISGKFHHDKSILMAK